MVSNCISLLCIFEYKKKWKLKNLIVNKEIKNTVLLYLEAKKRIEKSLKLRFRDLDEYNFYEIALIQLKKYFRESYEEAIKK